MEQVLLNFCVNARDAMLEGGTLTIDTENVLMDAEYCAAHAWATPGNYVLLSVTDTGCGMDAETQAHIFEPFFTTKELGKGTGLGLATVYGIVRQHQGMIQVYSEPEKGTTFKVYLPCVERAAATVAPKVAGRARGGTETILVAEDDATLRKLAELILETAGYTVLLATNGREALDVFEKHACGTDGSANIDLCLLDVIMPKLGGKAVYDALRPLHPRLRFLFSSGYSTSAIHRDLVLEEGIGLIQKPYAPDALLRKVRQVLDDVALIAEADPISESDEKQETNPK
jgi:CheY-like chemotaxis protein